MMSFVGVGCLVLCLVGLSQGRVSINKWDQDSYIRRNEKGVVDNCAPSGHKFNMTWDPKDIEAGITVKFDLDIVPEVDFTNGTLTLTGWVVSIPDPIIKQSIAATCKMAAKYLPLKCPVKKGVRITKKGFEVVVPAEVPIPPNDYKIEVEIHNSKNELLFCGKLTTSFKDGYYYQNRFNEIFKRK